MSNKVLIAKVRFFNTPRTSQNNTNLLQHISSAQQTTCILVTRELMRLLTDNFNIITQNTNKEFIKIEKLGMIN
jgi:hypothetical protein